MAYSIEFEPRVLKELKAIPVADQQRLITRIEALAADPRPAGVEKLKGQADAYRVRQGNYRIVYTIDDTIRIITISRVGHRREVYR